MTHLKFDRVAGERGRERRGGGVDESEAGKVVTEKERWEVRGSPRRRDGGGNGMPGAADRGEGNEVHKGTKARENSVKKSVR